MEILTKLKTESFLFKITSILQNRDFDFIERLEDAKTFCRETKGSLSWVSYELLDIIYKEIKAK